MAITIIAIILVLGGLIFFHELGHFCMARMLGIGVSTFSLGFGPKILKHKWGKTEYALSLIPLGGYVALVGESDPAELPEGFSMKESFATRPAWQRLLVIASGPVANIILAWVLCWILAFNWGTPVIQPVIGAVSANGPAAKAGIVPGDRIEKINGQNVESWQQMSDLIGASEGQPMELEIVRKQEGDQKEEISHIMLTAEKSSRKTIFGEEETAWLIGVRAGNSYSMNKESFWNASIAGARQTWAMVSLTWQSFVKLVQRVVPLDQVGGPIMIAQMVSQQAHEGLAGLLGLTALISVNLGILNLLPIPVLDGGQIVFCIYEMIFRRPLPQKAQEYATRAGLALLLGLMVLATFNDIWRLIK